MAEVEFSEQGEAPTEFEAWLLQTNGGEGHWEMAAQRLVQELGPAVAARALVAIFDELGSEKVHIPRRQSFFRHLWAEGRRDWATDRVHQDGWTITEVAAVLKIHPSRVARLVGAIRTKRNIPA